MTKGKSENGRALFYRDELKFAFAATDNFVGTVNAGQVFEVETEININSGVLTSLDKQLTEHDVTLPFVNPVTGPIKVKGAKAGDMLRVIIHKVDVEGIGTTALWPGVGIFPDWCRQKEFGIKNHNVLVKDGVVHWSDKVKLPVKPMIGCIATAPVNGGLMTVDCDKVGGNLDVQEVTDGNVVMLPVHHDGAYLYLGDCHAIQGDGECNGMGAIEIAAHLTVQVEVCPRPSEMTWPRIDTPTHICTIGCARPLEDAMRLAFQEMVFWLNADYGLSYEEAYMLLGQVAEARCTQMVNPKYTYICKVSKHVLEQF